MQESSATILGSCFQCLNHTIIAIMYQRCSISQIHQSSCLKLTSPMPSREASAGSFEVSLIGDVQSLEDINQEQEQVSKIVRSRIMIEWIQGGGTAC